MYQRFPKKFIGISWKKFTVTSIIVSNLSLLPTYELCFVLSAPEWKKLHKKKKSVKKSYAAQHFLRVTCDLQINGWVLYERDVHHERVKGACLS